MKRLEEICIFIRNGLNIKNDKSKKGIPVTRIETISNGIIDINKTGYANIFDDKYMDYYLRQDDILMSHINSLKHLGKVGYCYYDMKIIHGMNLLNIRVNPNNVYPKYLYYYFKSNNFKIKLNKISKQSVNQSSFSISDLKKIKIDIIDLKKQKLIASKLDKVVEVISIRKKQIEELNNLIKSQFVEMFNRKKINKKGWLETTVGEHIRLLTDFSANGSYKILDSKVIMYDEPNYAYMVRTIDLENKEYKNKVKYITKETYEFLSKSKVYPNDIIMNKIGSAGKVYIMPDLGIPVTLGRNAFLIRFNDNILPIYIYYLLTSEYGKKQIQKSIRGAVTKTITKDDVRKIKISVPPIDLQNQFSEIVKQIDKQKFEIEKSLKETQELYESLMEKYFG